MKRKKINAICMAYGAMIAALYVVLTMPFASFAFGVVQFRFAEALTILPYFTPAAIPGLTIGCLLFNLSFAGALPLDWLAGSFATFLACGSMWLLRRCPRPALSMPAWFNALFVGWELTIYFGETGFTMAAFWINALYVAIGELAVLYTLGWLLYKTMTRSGMARRIFGNT